MAAAAPSKRRSWRHRLYELLERGTASGPTEDVVHGLLVALVLVNVTAVVLESVPSLAKSYGILFATIEIASVIAFTVEYGLRLWCAPEHPPCHHLAPWRARLTFALEPQSLVDIVAIAPFYVALLTSVDLRSLLVLRLFRFFKLARYSPGLATLIEAMYSERRALIASGFILLSTVLITASAMHFAEQDAQPDKFGTIPDAMYWAVITLATVGYGDVVPQTGLGRIIAALTAVTGILMLALPVGILASAFAREIQRRDFVVTWSMVARVPIFAKLDAEQVAEIMHVLHSKSCEPGEVIVRRGEPAEAMYFIAAGTVEIELPHNPVRLRAGEFFGEIAILTRSKRTATVTALERTKLLVLVSRDLKHLLDHNQDMAAHIRAVAEARVGPEGIADGPQPNDRTSS